LGAEEMERFIELTKKKGDNLKILSTYKNVSSPNDRGKKGLAPGCNSETKGK